MLHEPGQAQKGDFLKLVLVSDIHGSLKKCRLAVKVANKNKASIVIAGDLINQDLKHAGKNFKKQLIILGKCKKKVYLIPGNYEDVKNWLLISDSKLTKYKSFVEFNKKIINLGSFYLIGYGGADVIKEEIVKKTYYRINPKEDELMLRQLLKIKGKPIIFVSHIPPYSYLDNAIFKIIKKGEKEHIEPAKTKDKNITEKKVGNKILKKIVEEHKPLLHVFGHIHESSGYEELITHAKVKESKNLVINSSKSIYLVNLKKNKAKIIDIIQV